MRKLENPSQWKGVWTALITPFTEDLKLDKPSLQKLIEMQIADGVTGLVIAGSTGEGSLLNDVEYDALLRVAVDAADGRIPIVAGLGIGGTRDSLRRARIAKGANVSGLLASVPAYIKPPVRGLIAHFLAIAGLELPVCLYDVPNRSALGLADEVIDGVLGSGEPSARFIHALKDATGKAERIAQRGDWQGRLALLSGDDESFPAFIDKGGHGVVSVSTHFALVDFWAVIKNPAAGKVRFDKLRPFIRALYSESNPIPVKSLAKKLGLITADAFQPPLVSMQPEGLAQLEELYRANFA